MTKDEILAMEPGRELDALVAEKLFGFTWGKTPPDIDGNFGGEPILIPPNFDHSNFFIHPKVGWAKLITLLSIFPPT